MSQMAYPTPPPTDSNSPSHPHGTYKFPSYFTASQNPLQYSSYSSSPYQPVPQPPQHSQSYGPPAKVSAQDSYFHSYSAPSSPLVPNAQPYAAPFILRSEEPPKHERRRSSPISSHPRRHSPLAASRANSPHRRRSPGNPNYYITSPIPLTASPKPLGRLSPYSLNRPQKRPGFWARILKKLTLWIRSFQKWAKDNPVKAGILTFFPIMTLAGVVKLARLARKGMGFVQKNSKLVDEKKKGLDGKQNGYQHEPNNIPEINSSKRGPLDGMLKMLQMLT